MCACLLDASKAFDRVQYGKIFALMLKRKMFGLVVSLLLDSYSRTTMHANFQVTNGIKQGGVLSPLLFIVYSNEQNDQTIEIQ